MQFSNSLQNNTPKNRVGIFWAEAPQYPHSIQNYRFSFPLQVQGFREFDPVRNKQTPPIASRFG